MRANSAKYPSLENARVFITGGATGIGAAMVRAFVDQGAQVGFIDIAEDAGQMLAAALPKTWFRVVDVTNTDALRAAVHAFIADRGGVDVLINNVANDTRHDWRDVTESSWDQTMAINLRPAFFAIQAVADHMIAQKSGSVINFGSISWKAKHDGMPGYTTAKAALHGLTRSFVKPLGIAHVRINTITPGWVMTDRQMSDHFDSQGAQMLAQNQPLAGRIQPQDAAALALFLAADDSAMCTGQEFTIDGGWS